ncbi:MAG: hypothetical protein JXK51_05975, partial [Halothiobacillaceae bacterium]|nr:hypothetical protein [Halothiobacillaceae bacterium]
IAYGHYGSLVKGGSFLPNDRLHKNSYTLAIHATTVTQVHKNSSPNCHRKFTLPIATQSSLGA